MKTVLLMRHAKSSWKDPQPSDHDRPLNKRGLNDAPRMGRILHDRELVPQCILSSSALRARQTAEAIIPTSGYKEDILYLDQLYMAEADEYISVLRELSDSIERVMVIGHNPGLEMLLQMLSGQIESLPTAVIAHLVLPIHHWSELNSDTNGELIDIWRPKELFSQVGEDAAQKEVDENGKKSKTKKPDHKTSKKKKR